MSTSLLSPLPKATGTMTDRARFLATMRYQEILMQNKIPQATDYQRSNFQEVAYSRKKWL